MKQDRFLIIILAGITLLVISAFALFFLRQSQNQYAKDDTPAGVVQNYILALHKADYPKAYGYLASGENKPTLDDFSRPFLTKMNDIDRTDVQIGETNMVGKNAVISITMTHFSDSPYDRYESRDSALLEMENGAWKIKQMPQPFWDYDWYHSTMNSGG